MTKFTHLHVHTEYSLLDGSSKIKEIVKRTKELGMDSIAITDHGVMYGVIDFYRAAKEIGIKPILGCEIYVAPGSRFDKEVNLSEDRYYHLVLLAENNQGYQNLMKIVSGGFIDGFYYRPRVDDELLAQYSEGIIALSACLAGEVQRNVTKGQYEEAVKAAKKYEAMFGGGNFFLELQDHGIKDQANANAQIIRMSKETGIGLVCTNDIHYTYAEDAAAHDVLLCIQTAKKVTDENRMRYEGDQFYCKSPEEMAALFPYAPEALENTYKISERCNVDIEFGVTKLPKFDVPAGYNSWEYLNELCEKGLHERYGKSKGSFDDHHGIKEKLDFELNVIKEMGYIDYFLIVWDFIRFAKNNSIIVGPGRGSAAGSLVSYSLGITDIDPLKYQLLFERFLNPERVSMPDIDIDFCYERRQEVIDYVVEKYGKDKVVQIITFGTMAARGVIRDVARALDLPYSTADIIAKMIPNELNITIEKALKVNQELNSMYESDSSVKELIDMSLRLEGLPRHTSMHAAGVVISRQPIDEYVPVARAADGSVTTQFVMNTLEELGLLKMDFLGLRTLTVIQNAVRLAEKRIGKQIGLDDMEYNDKQVLESIGTGKTEGIFQLESAGMKSFMRELRPESLEDIIAGISLYRPGPMEFIPKYIKGKREHQSITYDCPALEPILKPTYGCIVYQEQVMQIVRDLGGYSLGRSDLLRRAMSKKKQSVMEKERQNFVYGNADEGVSGCVKNGISEQVANKIYDEMIDFAKYAFNKSHAAAYAVLSYQTAYLKYYYPLEFMAALMTSVIDNTSKVSEYILSCRSMGIHILPPDINEGEGVFSVSGNGIRYGLSAIKSVGRSVIDTIVAEREANGPYTSLRDLCERLSGKEVNKRTIECFIKSGAFDNLGGTRRQLMEVYATVIDTVNRQRKNAITGQMSLFDLVDDTCKEDFEIKYPNVGEYSKAERLSFEKEVMGVYVSGHPLEEYEALIKKHATAATSDFTMNEEGGAVVSDGQVCTVGGMITGISVKTTRSNKMMAFITLEDLVGIVEVLIFPTDYEKYKSNLFMDHKVFVKGKVSMTDEEGKMVCQCIIPFDDFPKEIWIKFKDKHEYMEKEKGLFDILRYSEGNDRVIIYIEQEKARKILPGNMAVKVNKELENTLTEMYGEKNVKVVEKTIESDTKIYYN